VAFRLLLPGVLRPLPPPSLALDNSPQGLAAGEATKPLTRVPLGASEALFAPGTITAEKIGIARLRADPRVPGRTLRRDIASGVGSLGLGVTAAVGAAAAVPAALVLAFLLAVGRFAVMPASSRSSPATCRGAALEATVPRLRMNRPEKLLTPLE
jgi:hypothetical protein